MLPNSPAGNRGDTGETCRTSTWGEPLGGDRRRQTDALIGRDTTTILVLVGGMIQWFQLVEETRDRPEEHPLEGWNLFGETDA